MFVYGPPRRERRVTLKVTRAERTANRIAREELAASLEADFLKIVGKWQRSAMIGDIEAHIASSGVVGLVDGPLRYGELEAQIGATINDTFRQALERGVDIGLRFSGIEGIALNAEMVTARAVSWINTTGAERVLGISVRTRRALRAVIRDQITDVISPTEAAKRIGRAVGLDERGVNALRRYEEQLVRRWIPTPEADTRAVRRTIADEVERHRQKLLRARGQRIAQTETQTAIHQGERQFWDQAITEGHVDRPDLAQKRWHTAGDPCRHCEPLGRNGGTVVGINELFATSLGPAYEPPLHVNCYCYLEYSPTGFGRGT